MVGGLGAIFYFLGGVGNLAEATVWAASKHAIYGPVSQNIYCR